MKRKTHNEIIKHHDELFDEFGVNPASMGWPKGRIDLRFKTMTNIGNLNNSTILDVGCGFGYFLTYLKKHKKRIDYTGIDINSKFIEIAKKQHKKEKFEIRDIEKQKFKKKFDWVFAVGLASKADSYEYLESLLNEMCKIAKKGVVMDFVTDYVDYKNKGTFYSSPEKIFKITKKISKRVVLRHDYLPYEFCAYIYTDDKIERKDNTFKDVK
jgi:SAM-dependent methyltransferase